MSHETLFHGMSSSTLLFCVSSAPINLNRTTQFLVRASLCPPAPVPMASTRPDADVSRVSSNEKLLRAWPKKGKPGADCTQPASHHFMSISHTVLGSNLWGRFCNMFYESSPCSLGWCGSCRDISFGNLTKHFARPSFQVMRNVEVEKGWSSHNEYS